MNNKLVKLELLDFLRGTLAFLVMIYHFNLWNGNKTNFLNFIGIYGVESFFILSGVVLTYTYSKNKLDIFSYFMKRFLRILPLFYFVVLIEIIYKILFVDIQINQILQVIIGDLFLFNMFQPHLTSVVSGWSIMVEMLFYMLFPLLLLIKKEYIYLITVLIVVFTYCIFNFYILDFNEPFEPQNKYYVSFIFNFLFFLIGMSIAKIRLNTSFYIQNYKILFLAIIVILIWSNIYRIENYMFFLMNEYRIISILLISILIFICTFTIFEHKSNFISNTLSFFAKISYSLYLLHFLVYFFVTSFLNINNLYIIVIATILISYISYLFIELKFTSLLRRYVFKQK